jgi:hypothetical protein
METVKEQRKILRWAEPDPLPFLPHRGHGGPPGSEWDEVADQLRSEPGKSAVVYEGTRNGASSVASIFSRGTLVATRPAGAFEVQRRTAPGTQVVEVFVKYVGDQS